MGWSELEWPEVDWSGLKWLERNSIKPLFSKCGLGSSSVINWVLVPGIALQFYTSGAKRFKLTARKSFFFGGGGVTSTFLEVTGEKLVGRPFCPQPQKWSSF